MNNNWNLKVGVGGAPIEAPQNYLSAHTGKTRLRRSFGLPKREQGRLEETVLPASCYWQRELIK
jgi:hypothetical protein